MEKSSPFMYKGGEGVNAGVGEVEWVISRDRSVSEHFSVLFFKSIFRYKYDPIFDTLNPIDGKISGTSAKGTKNISKIISTSNNTRACY